jgi:hypothetical protein
VKFAFLARPLASTAIACALLCALPAWAQDDITHAQPLLRMEPLTIVTHRGAFRFRAEIADTPRSEEIGLMYRPRLGADRGMLFEMGPPQEADFWMKHCPTPLDMLFIAADGRIIKIARNTTPYSEAGIDSGGPITGVLELRGGRAAEIGAEPGDFIRHPYFQHG